MIKLNLGFGNFGALEYLYTDEQIDKLWDDLMNLTDDDFLRVKVVSFKDIPVEKFYSRERFMLESKYRKGGK